MMNFTRENNKIYAKDSFGKIVCEIDFPSENEGEVTITHTFVDESLRGKGVAKLLVDEVVKVAKEEQLKIVPKCSYAVKYFEKYKENSHLL